MSAQIIPFPAAHRARAQSGREWDTEPTPIIILPVVRIERAPERAYNSRKRLPALDFGRPSDSAP